MKGPALGRKSAWWLLVSLVCAASMEFYTAKIWGLGQAPNFSDLYAPFWGSHEALLHRRNPYSAAVTHEIQTVIYGAAANSAHPGDSSEMGGGFAYPLYSSFLFWLVVYMSFSTARMVFAGVSVLAVLGTLAIWLREFGYELWSVESLAITFFTFGSFPILQGLRLQNLSLLAAAFISLALFLLANGRLLLAGAVLAAATFKPQFVVLLLPWLAVWTASNWRQRKAVAWSFLVSLTVLITAAEWLVPGWISDFLRVVRAYRDYTPGNSLLDLWFTRRGGPFAAAVLVLVLFALAWRHRRAQPGSDSMLAIGSLFLASTLVVIPTLAPHTQVLLLPGVLCVLRCRGLLSTGLSRLGVLALWLLLAWPWVLVLGLAMAALRVPMTLLSQWWQLPLETSPILPLAAVVALTPLLRKPGLSDSADSAALII